MSPGSSCKRALGGFGERFGEEEIALDNAFKRASCFHDVLWSNAYMKVWLPGTHIFERGLVQLLAKGLK
jgi:hypothetical protein